MSGRILANQATLIGWNRKDDWSVPLDILREAVINALVHSEYSQQGGPIRVAFYDDHVYVESLGGLLPGMTIETMRSGMSRIRNQVIARVFPEAHMIEQWGVRRASCPEAPGPPKVPMNPLTVTPSHYPSHYQSHYQPMMRSIEPSRSFVPLERPYHEVTYSPRLESAMIHAMPPDTLNRCCPLAGL